MRDKKMNSITSIWVVYFYAVIAPFILYVFAKTALDLKLSKIKTIMCFIFIPSAFILDWKKGGRVLKELRLEYAILMIMIIFRFVVNDTLNNIDKLI